MNKLRKALVVILSALFLLCVSLFAACTDGSGKTQAQKPDDTATPGQSEQTPEEKPDDPQEETCDVNVEVNDEALGAYRLSGERAENGKFKVGTPVTVTVEPAEGYDATLKVNGEEVPLDGGSYTFTADEDTTVSVDYNYKYTISTTVLAGEGTITPAPAAAEDGKYVPNEEVKVTVTPKEGYGIDYVKVNGEVVTPDGGAGNDYTVTVDGRMYVVARFVKVYTVSVTNGGDATVTLDGNECTDPITNVKGGTVYTLKVTPGEDEIKAVYVNGALTPLDEGGEATITVKADTVIKVVYYGKYTVTAPDAGSHVVVSIQEGEQASYKEGTVLHITVSAAEGYQLSSVTVKVGETEVKAVGGVYTVTVTADVTITAAAELLPVEQHTVTILSSNGSMGEAKLAPAEGEAVAGNTYDHGTELTLTVTPKEGNTVDRIEVNNKRVKLGNVDGAYTYTFTLDADTTIYIVYKTLTRYYVTVDDRTGDDATIKVTEPFDADGYYEGQILTITATDIASHCLVFVALDGGEPEDIKADDEGNYIWTHTVTADVKITVTVLHSYSVETHKTPEEGGEVKRLLDGDNTEEVESWYQEDVDVTLIITANQGYRISKVTVVSNGKTLEDTAFDSVVASHMVYLASENTVVTVEYVAIYEISVNVAGIDGVENASVVLTIVNTESGEQVKELETLAESSEKTYTLDVGTSLKAKYTAPVTHSMTIGEALSTPAIEDAETWTKEMTTGKGGSVSVTYELYTHTVTVDGEAKDPVTNSKSYTLPAQPEPQYGATTGLNRNYQYTFAWVVNGVEYEAEAVVENVRKDLVIVGKWSAQLPVEKSVTGTPEGASVNWGILEEAGTLIEGTEFDITITVPQGYRAIVKYYIHTKNAASGNEGTSNPSTGVYQAKTETITEHFKDTVRAGQKLEIVITFEKIFTVTVEENENVDVEVLSHGDYNNDYFTVGNVYEFTVTAHEGYKVTAVKANDTVLDLADGKYSHVLTGETTITIETVKLYKVTVADDSSADATVEFDDEKAYYDPQTEVKFTVTAHEGYIVTKVTANDVEVALTEGKYSVTVADQDIVIKVETTYDLKVDFPTQGGEDGSDGAPVQGTWKATGGADNVIEIGANTMTVNGEAVKSIVTEGAGDEVVYTLTTEENHTYTLQWFGKAEGYILELTDTTVVAPVTSSRRAVRTIAGGDKSYYVNPKYTAEEGYFAEFASPADKATLTENDWTAQDQPALVITENGGKVNITLGEDPAKYVFAVEAGHYLFVIGTTAYDMTLKGDSLTVNEVTYNIVTYTVTLKADTEHVTDLTFEVAGPYKANTQVKFKVNVEEGYDVVSVKVEGKDEALALGDDGYYTVTVETADIVIIVETEKAIKTIEPQAGTSFYASNFMRLYVTAEDLQWIKDNVKSVKVNSEQYGHGGGAGYLIDGTTIQVQTANDEADEYLLEWYSGEKGTGEIVAVTTYKQPDSYEVTLTVNGNAEGDGNTATLNPAAGTIARKTEVTLTVTVAGGYKVKVEVNGATVELTDGTTYTFTLKANTNIVVTFSVKSAENPEVSNPAGATLEGGTLTIIVNTKNVDDTDELKKNLTLKAGEATWKFIGAGNTAVAGQYKLTFNQIVDLTAGEYLLTMTAYGQDFTNLTAGALANVPMTQGDKVFTLVVKSDGLYLKVEAAKTEFEVTVDVQNKPEAVSGSGYELKNGDVTVNSGDTVPANTKLTLKVTPADRYKATVSVTGGTMTAGGDNNSYTITVTAATTITITYAEEGAVEKSASNFHNIGLFESSVAGQTKFVVSLWFFSTGYTEGDLKAAQLKIGGETVSFLDGADNVFLSPDGSNTKNKLCFDITALGAMDAQALVLVLGGQEYEVKGTLDAGNASKSFNNKTYTLAGDNNTQCTLTIATSGSVDQKTLEYYEAVQVRTHADTNVIIQIAVKTSGFTEEELKAATLKGLDNVKLIDGSTSTPNGNSLLFFGINDVAVNAEPYEIILVIGGQEFAVTANLGAATVTYDNKTYTLSKDGDKLYLTVSAAGSVEPDNNIEKADDEKNAVDKHSGKWTYYVANSAKVTEAIVSDDGTVTFTFEENTVGQWFDLQLYYVSSKIGVDEKYSLSFTITSKSGGNYRFFSNNDAWSQTKQLNANEGTLVTFASLTCVADKAHFSLFMGTGDGSQVSADTITITNFKIEKVTDPQPTTQKYAAPSGGENDWLNVAFEQSEDDVYLVVTIKLQKTDGEGYTLDQLLNLYFGDKGSDGNEVHVYAVESGEKIEDGVKLKYKVTGDLVGERFMNFYWNDTADEDNASRFAEGKNDRKPTVETITYKQTTYSITWHSDWSSCLLHITLKEGVSITVESVDLRVVDNLACYVVTFTATGIEKAELERDLKYGNKDSNAYYDLHKLEEQDGKYVAYFDVTEAPGGGAWVWSHLYLATTPFGGESGDIKTGGSANGKSITLQNKIYSILNSSEGDNNTWGIDVLVVKDITVTVDYSTIKLELVDGKPVLTLEGTYANCTQEQVIFDLELAEGGNGTTQYSFMEGTTFAEGHFTIKIDLSNAPAAVVKYVPHLRYSGYTSQGAGNLVNEAAELGEVGEPVEYDGKTYQLVVDNPWDSKMYFLSVIESGAANLTYESAELKEEGDKVYVVVTVSAFENCTEDDLKAGASWKYNNVTVLAEKVEVVDGKYQLWFDITDVTPDGEWIIANEIRVNGKIANSPKLESSVITGADITKGTTTYHLERDPYRNNYIYFSVIKKLTVTFNYGYGEQTRTEKVTYSKDYNLPDDLKSLTRTGYTFDGWYLNDDTKLEEEGGKLTVKNVTENVTYTAHWAPIDNTVVLTVTGNDENVAGSVEVKQGETVVNDKGTVKTEAVLTITVIVNAGYRVTVTVNNASTTITNLEGEEGGKTETVTYTVVGSTDNTVTIAVTFVSSETAKSYNVEASIQPAGTDVNDGDAQGAITNQEGFTSHQSGESVTISFVVAKEYGATATANAGVELGDPKIVAEGDDYKYTYKAFNMPESAVTVTITVAKRLVPNDGRKTKWAVGSDDNISYYWEWFDVTRADDTDKFGTITLSAYDATGKDAQTYDFTLETPYASVVIVGKGDYARSNIEEAIRNIWTQKGSQGELQIVFAFILHPSENKAKLGYTDSELWYATEGGRDIDGSSREVKTYNYGAEPVITWDTAKIEKKSDGKVYLVFSYTALENVDEQGLATIKYLPRFSEAALEAIVDADAKTVSFDLTLLPDSKEWRTFNFTINDNELKKPSFTKVETGYIYDGEWVYRLGGDFVIKMSIPKFTFEKGEGATGEDPVIVINDSIHPNDGGVFTVKVPECTYTAPAGKYFRGWEIAGAIYFPGEDFDATYNTTYTVKAVWEDFVATVERDVTLYALGDVKSFKAPIYEGTQVELAVIFSGATAVYHGLLLDVNANNAWYRLRVDPAAFGLNSQSVGTDTWANTDPMFDQLKIIDTAWNSDRYLALFNNNGKVLQVATASLSGNVLTYTVSNYAATDTDRSTLIAATTFELTVTGATELNLEFYADGLAGTIKIDNAHYKGNAPKVSDQQSASAEAPIAVEATGYVPRLWTTDIRKGEKLVLKGSLTLTADAVQDWDGPVVGLFSKGLGAIGVMRLDHYLLGADNVESNPQFDCSIEQLHYVCAQNGTLTQGQTYELTLTIEWKEDGTILYTAKLGDSYTSAWTITAMDGAALAERYAVELIGEDCTMSFTSMTRSHAKKA